MLHITNGESVQLVEAKVPGEILVWADPLHEGPVPEDLDLDELSVVRSRFLAGHEDAFQQRDATLRQYAEHEEVVLWFEHDLFDQLLLVQLLDWFNDADLSSTKLSLVQAGDYLGHMNPARLASLFRGRASVSPAQLDVAAEAWAAFRSPLPDILAELRTLDTSALPWLAGAVQRLIEHYPDLAAGLSKTERQILEHAAAGIHDRTELFRANQQREERIFMGDDTFFSYVDRLMGASTPLLHQDGRLTEAGRRVLDGEADAIELNGIDRWIGGVHLQTTRHWRWDATASELRVILRSH